MRISSLMKSGAGLPNLLPVGGPRRPPVAGMATTPFAAAIPTPSLGLEGLLQGRVLGDRYEILDVIRRGGMGVVYRAMDQRLGREVAVKVLSASAPDVEGQAVLRSRFARQARAVAGIRHENVVAIHDQGTDTDLGIDFLVMELLEGEDLGTLVRKLGLPRMNSVLRLLRQAAAGVAAGHRAGLIHRDIKPANLFLESSEGDVRVKVLNFGVPGGSADLESTIGSLGGEPDRALPPAFASPERLRGEVALTRGSDVFSLGAVAHHLLTGERLSESIEPHIALREMEAARTALFQDLRLPLKLREVLAQALASHPEDRFRDAGALLIALDAVPAVDTVEPEPDPQGIRSVVTPAMAAAAELSRSRTLATGLTEGIQRTGAALLVALVASISFLTLLAGEWSTVGATIAVFGAAAFLPLPGAARGNGASPRIIALAVATVILLAVLLTRAALGSLTGLLFAQLVITWIVLRLTTARRSDAADGATHPLIRESW